MTISIQGAWGSGKTSIMNMVQNRINDKVIPVFFNTWQFSQLDLGNNLPISMLKVFLNKISNGKIDALSQKLLKLGKKGIKILLNAATRSISGGLLEGPFDKDHPQEYVDFTEALEDLHSSLQFAAEECCNNAGKDRIVVFIDDLDRLVPSKAMELLEVLKLFFDCTHCVFVFTIDYDVVIRGAAEKYGFNLNDHSSHGQKEAEKGRAFFDKIIQVPFKVPVVEYDIKSYLVEVLQKIDINPNNEDMPKYQKLCALSLGTNPRGLK
ncbi:KAP family P-loop domain-containing protein [Succinivibrio dextrinosolvens DSM 3072]|uniref:KAP family P-loop domain-containing protein n=2 Tax=Succinivibrio dextrinosolvens TaxID=83771 RepID=A0A1T4UZE6_9GAMM|nr:KAP family P-loop domain-containing protein [Succinivibrio dextrinosolvens DSM 3072]